MTQETPAPLSPAAVRAAKNAPHPVGTVVGVKRNDRGERYPVAVADGRGGVVFVFGGFAPDRD